MGGRWREAVAREEGRERAAEEAAERARREAEAEAKRREVERAAREKAEAEAEARARAEAEARARAEAEARARAEAEAEAARVEEARKAEAERKEREAEGMKKEAERAAEERRLELKRAQVAELRAKADARKKGVADEQGFYAGEVARLRALRWEAALGEASEASARFVAGGDSGDAAAKRMIKGVAKNIKKRVNQLSTTVEQCSRVGQWLHDEVLGPAQQASETHPDAYLHCLLSLAHAVLIQCELMVRDKLAMGYAWGRCLVVLCTWHPQLAVLLRAKAARACMYSVPRYRARLASLSAEENAERSGYRKAQDGAFENDLEHSERMASYCRLLACIAQADPVEGQVHPFRKMAEDQEDGVVPEGRRGETDGLCDAWCWTAEALNLPARAVLANCLAAYLEVAGAPMQAKYGRQFAKLMAYMRDHWCPALGTAVEGLSWAGSLKNRVGNLVTAFYDGGFSAPPERELPLADESQYSVG